MAAPGQTEQKKWLNASIAIAAILVGYVTLGFVTQMGEWFELESRIKYYQFWTQALGVLVGLITFIAVITNKRAYTFLRETYIECIKVVWPDKSDTVRQTIGIIIGVTIVGFILGFFDYAVSKILGLIY